MNFDDVLEKIKRNKKKLKPCPFCGSVFLDILIFKHGYAAKCNDCGCELKQYSKYIKQIVFAWNKRFQ